MATTRWTNPRAGIPNEPRVYGCGCKAYIARIEHCPTHAKAPVLLAVLRELLPLATRAAAKAVLPGTLLDDAIEEAREILRAVEG